MGGPAGRRVAGGEWQRMAAELWLPSRLPGMVVHLCTAFAAWYSPIRASGAGRCRRYPAQRGQPAQRGLWPSVPPFIWLISPCTALLGARTCVRLVDGGTTWHLCCDPLATPPCINTGEGTCVIGHCQSALYTLLHLLISAGRPEELGRTGKPDPHLKAAGWRRRVLLTPRQATQKVCGMQAAVPPPARRTGLCPRAPEALRPLPSRPV